MNRVNNSFGFALIEILVVMAILAVLMGITLVAINPFHQFQQANNIKRRSDVRAILDAISQYSIENRGQIPAVITTSIKIIRKTDADLCTLLIPTFIAALPVDPKTNNGTEVTDCTSSYNTNYSIVKNATGRITVSAPAAENNETISVSQ